jgi:hypothetical protein
LKTLHSTKPRTARPSTPKSNPRKTKIDAEMKYGRGPERTWRALVAYTLLQIWAAHAC